MTIIDAHHHLWRLGRAPYPWLGDHLPAINRSMEFPELQPLLDGAGVQRTVVVQGSDFAEDTEYLLEQASLHPRIAGVVAWVPLAEPEEAARQLDLLAEHPKFCGIRHGINFEPDPDWLLRDDVSEGLELLAERDIPFDVVSVRRRHLELVPELAERHPRLRLVIDHLSKPPVKREDWDPWRTNLARAAENPRVFAKISGLFPSRGDMQDWTVHDIHPFVDYALELFGPDRLMAGSDWPIANLAGGYQRVWSGVLESIAHLPEPDRAAILGGTASAFYSLHD